MSNNLVQTSFRDAANITPSDTVPQNGQPFMAIWVGGAGNLTIITPQGSTVTFNAVAAGTLIPIQAATVKVTGTTATLLVGLL